ncbi:protease inhibitor I42 family protein [Methylocystis parvus]|uniref:Protease inhibitor I42 family protein n=1 Tax=Methylocystis parvus TaxID=134 RepID=A0A6B8M8C4_9HYPH|nr:protease inhibitor I42 family protein [Methylocystis parvus]QGM98818.1 protease inhibitor I42 family protein [Methylocystis parvus]WBK00833.1 protease inhibitor I42 family protein [Methylocystis parvus OBBP]
MKRRLILAAAAVIISQAAAAETLRLAPGERARFTLKENPSTGYVWRIDAAASAGLDRVAIADAGHKRGASMPGAPGEHRWIICGAHAGRAVIAFAHQRPWEPAPAETRRLEVLVAPR